LLQPPAFPPQQVPLQQSEPATHVFPQDPQLVGPLKGSPFGQV
jgi:hypothetical protein